MLKENKLPKKDILMRGKWLSLFFTDRMYSSDLINLEKDAISLFKLQYNIDERDPIIFVAKIFETTKPYPDLSLFEAVRKVGMVLRDLCTYDKRWLLSTPEEMRLIGKWISGPILSKMKETGIIDTIDYRYDIFIQRLKESPDRDPENKIIKDYETNRIGTIIDLLSEIFSLINYLNDLRSIILTSLKYISDNTLKWEEGFSEIINDNKYNGADELKALHQAYVNVKSNSQAIKDKFGDIGPFLNSSFIVNSFIGDPNVDDLPPILPVFYKSVFPWDSILGRVLFEFLISGGQDYYDFCHNSQCNKLIFAQRKGRKEYCDDTCRVSANNKRRGMTNNPENNKS